MFYNSHVNYKWLCWYTTQPFHISRWVQFRQHFYHATLSISAIFAVVRCPFVCLSRRCIHTAEDIVKLLSRPGRAVFLFFFTPSAGTQFQGELLQRGRKIEGGAWEHFAIFDWNRCISWKRYEIGPWLVWNVNRKYIGDESIRVGSDDLEWLVTQVSMSLYSYKSNITKL